MHNAHCRPGKGAMASCCKSKGEYSDWPSLSWAPDMPVVSGKGAESHYDPGV